MTSNGREDENGETESAKLSDTCRPEKSQYPSPEGTTHVSSSVVSLLCGICFKYLISEPCSIKCDNNSCKALLHTSCIGNYEPADSEPWICQKCRNTDESQQSNDESENEIAICAVCNKTIKDNGILCEGHKPFKTWFHKSRSKLSNIKFKQLLLSRDPWFCDECSKQRAHETHSHIVWGKYVGVKAVYEKVSSVQDEIA
jgi:hypothetical protein